MSDHFRIWLDSGIDPTNRYQTENGPRRADDIVNDAIKKCLAELSKQTPVGLTKAMIKTKQLKRIYVAVSLRIDVKLENKKTTIEDFGDTFGFRFVDHTGYALIDDVESPTFKKETKHSGVAIFPVILYVEDLKHVSPVIKGMDYRIYPNNYATVKSVEYVSHSYEEGE